MSLATKDGVYEIDLPFFEPQPEPKEPINAGAACWRQRRLVDQHLNRIQALIKAVDGRTELTPYQWVQLMSMVLEYKPDLILELGRGDGNSTCVFTEAANILKPDPVEVISLCLSEEWERKTLPKIRALMYPSWFEPLSTFVTDIRDFNYEAALEGRKRILVFWDAHGFNVADCVLGRILPLIDRQEHLVIMHDLSDGRVMPFLRYGESGLWRGNDWSGPRLMLGCINSCVEQAVSIVDFCSRNQVTLHSADQAIVSLFEKDEEKLLEMEGIFGPEMFQLQAHWYYFSLNESPGPFSFPVFNPESKTKDMNDLDYLRQEVRKAGEIIGRQSEMIAVIAAETMKQAEYLLSLGQKELASEKLKEGRRLGRGINAAGLHYSLALGFLKLEMTDEAVAALKKELDIAPNNAPAAALLAGLRDSSPVAEPVRKKAPVIDDLEMLKSNLADYSLTVPNETRSEQDVVVELVLETEHGQGRKKVRLNIKDLGLAGIKQRFRDDPWMENYMVNMWEYATGQSVCRTYPWNVTIPVADICNASCPFCTSWFAGQRYLELDELEAYRPVLKYAQHFGLQGHGEPLIHPHFVKLTKMIGPMLDPRCKVYIITNGALLKKYFTDLERLNITGYSISLNAATARTHHELMDLGRNTFDNIVESVKRLVAIRDAGDREMSISLSMVVTRKNISEAAAFVEMANRLNVSLVYLRTLAPANDLTGLPNYHDLPPYLHQEFERHRREAVQAIKQSKIPVAAYPDTWDVPIFPTEIEEMVKTSPPALIPKDRIKAMAGPSGSDGDDPEKKAVLKGRLLPDAGPLLDDPGDSPYDRRPRYYCKFPYSNLNMTDFSLCMYPCCYMNNVPGYEHMRYDGRADFHEIWNSPAMVELRRSLKEGPLMGPCRHCPPNR
jgi:wyosine [tRNA(Phe)-imidazoG37] synthetase (radical SAM superfamily)/tetratricopeptide (TPR) repeat protein